MFEKDKIRQMMQRKQQQNYFNADRSSRIV